uniref:Uncharacterized protein n=1 Tax=Magallana gigas TaxID=29159 RepID=K1R016_MAGGI
MVSIVFGDRQNMFKTILCLNFWFSSSFAYVFADNREKVIRCIAGNVTMQFKPKLVDDKEVKTYVWNKFRGVHKDPSFAKFEPSVSSQLEIYFNEEHQTCYKQVGYGQKGPPDSRLWESRTWPGLAAVFQTAH